MCIFNDYRKKNNKNQTLSHINNHDIYNNYINPGTIKS